jgi:hypothetical protein
VHAEERRGRNISLPENILAEVISRMGAYRTVVIAAKAWPATPTMADNAAELVRSIAFVCCLYSAAVAAVPMMTRASTGPNRQLSAKRTPTAPTDWDPKT